MKFKLDFVTNSSSASIYLMIKSKYDDIEDFRESFNQYMDEYIRGDWGTPEKITHFWDGIEMEKKGKNTYVVKAWTSMFNYATDDIPHYMQALYLSWIVDQLDIMNRFGFERVKIKVVDEH